MFEPDQVKTQVRGKLLANEPLSNYTSWRTGGPADWVYIPADSTDLANFLQSVPKEQPVTWLGLGSNTLVRDGGLEGIVIVTQGGLNQLSMQAEKVVRAEAGVSCAQLARHSARSSLTGLEFMAGIPGTVGGALAMNAGCFGGETWQKVLAVETIDRYGKLYLRPAREFTVGYRHVTRPAEECFVAGHFQLSDGDKATALESIRLLLEKRNATQPTGTANCGSVFRNPTGTFAGKLIQECGLKGKRIGGAVVSEKHANFILNETNASSADIEALINEVRSVVLAQTGVELLAEVCIIGRE